MRFGNPRTPAFALPRWAWPVLLGFVAVAAAWQCARVGVNQDVRQVLGVLHSADGGGWSAAQTWAHRPVASRLVVATLGGLTPTDPVAADRAARAICTLLAAGAAAVLGHGLIRPFGRQGAGLVAITVGGALMIAPAWDFAEPEWFAATGAVLAIGLALALGPWTGATVGGLALAVVSLLKYTTLPVAVVAVGCVWLLDGTRGRRLAYATAVATPVLFGVSLIVAPHDWQWLRDMPLLNPPLTGAAALRVVEGIANHVLVSPLTLLGLTVLLDLAVASPHQPTRRAGRRGLLAMALLALPFVVQHQGFLYHLAPLPVFAAGAAAAAVVRQRQAQAAEWARAEGGIPLTWALSIGCGTVAGVGVFAAPAAARDRLWWLGLVLIVAAACWPWTSRIWRRVLPLAAAPLLLLPLAVTLSPRTAYSVSMAHSTVTAATNRRQAVDAQDQRTRVAAVLPPEAPVVHLGFGTPWVLPNPSICRYVSPTFLQRGTLPGVRDTASFRENLACLDDPRARYAVIETSWFDLAKVPAPVAEAVRRNFPCPTPAYRDASILVCPRG